jgi:hypothetical protein
MKLQDVIDHMPPRQDLMRLARYLSSLRRPSRAEVLLYGLGGVLVGAGLALLFAPSRGSELRSRLGERFDEYWNGLESLRSNGAAPPDHH